MRAHLRTRWLPVLTWWKIHPLRLQGPCLSPQPGAPASGAKGDVRPTEGMLYAAGEPYATGEPKAAGAGAPGCPSAAARGLWEQKQVQRVYGGGAV